MINIFSSLDGILAIEVIVNLANVISISCVYKYMHTYIPVATLSLGVVSRGAGCPKSKVIF